jgi:hypothetical protein
MVRLPGSFADDDEPSASLVRPYSRTGGRTRPVHEFELEALVAIAGGTIDSAVAELLSPEHSSIIHLCRATTSVAEIAVGMDVPLGVARVIIADMVELGLVEVLRTSAAGDERDPDFLRRVLSGLQRL